MDRIKADMQYVAKHPGDVNDFSNDQKQSSVSSRYGLLNGTLQNALARRTEARKLTGVDSLFQPRCASTNNERTTPDRALCIVQGLGPVRGQRNERSELLAIASMAGGLVAPLQALKRPEDPNVAHFSAGATSSLDSSQKISASRNVSPVLDRQKLLAAFGTVKQTTVANVEEMDHADEAAFQEAISRSLQEKAFGMLVKPEPQATQSSTTRAPDRMTGVVANQAGKEEKPSEVSESIRAQQMLGYAEPNNAFREHLNTRDLEVIPNPGRGNNCAIYALVQQVRPELKPDELEQEVVQLRGLYDQQCPSDKDKMLFLDTGVGGAANNLIGLVNTRYGVNIQVGVVEAGFEEAHPVTSHEPISAPSASTFFTHRFAIWDQQGHYEAVTAKSDNQLPAHAEYRAQL